MLLTAPVAHGKGGAKLPVTSEPMLSENDMSQKADRGKKRICQNGECGARFYDLNRETIACPICASAYVPPPVAAPTEPAAAKPQMRRVPKAPDIVVDPAAAPDGEVPEVVADELADIETPEADIAVEEAETFLEPEEEGEGAVSDIIGGGVAGEDEEA